MFKKISLFFLVFGALVLFFQNIHALTLAEITTEVRRRLNDNPGSSSRQRYSDSTLYDSVNSVQREVVNATWPSQNTTSYVLTAGVTFYALPDNLIAIAKVEFSDDFNGVTELSEVSLKGLYASNSDWRQQSGTPYQYYISEANISSASLSGLQISYIPIPTSQSTGTVTIQYFNYVQDLSTTTGNLIPFDGKKQLFGYHDILVYGATARIKLLEGRLEEAKAYYGLYGAGVDVMRARINSSPNYTPGMQVYR